MKQITSIVPHLYSLSKSCSIFFLTFFFFVALGGFFSNLFDVLFSLKINLFSIPIALFISTLIAYKLNPHIRGIVVAYGLTFISFLVSYIAIDFSWDGLAYHQWAIEYIAKGQNNIYQDTGNIWVDHYPKMSWYFGAEVYKVFGDIQFGKVYHFLFAAFTFFNTLRFSKSIGCSEKLGFIFSFLAALNPVFLAQFDTFYIDDILGSCTFALFLSAILIVKKNELYDWIVLSLCSVIAINLKFSGLLPVGMSFLFILIVGCLNRENFKSFFRKTVLTGGITVVTAIFVVGYNPYLKNILMNKHPLYPLFGVEKVDIMSASSPISFHSKNRLEKLVISIFSKSEDIYFATNAEPKLKIPGAVSAAEIKSLTYPDTRMSGWGPLFSMSLIIGLLYFILSPKRARELYYLVGLIIISGVIHPEGWWARYFPIFIAIPLSLACFPHKCAPSRYNTWLRNTLISIMVLNVLLIVPRKIGTVKENNRTIEKAVASLSNQSRVYPANNFLIFPIIKRFNISPAFVDKEYYENNKESFEARTRLFFVELDN